MILDPLRLRLYRHWADAVCRLDRDAVRYWRRHLDRVNLLRARTPYPADGC
jgi:hypothetical protein